jgi:isopentenyl diphosphate isomerase/L-lactate dehydrogenase-like FMN-dependent dehydrogenase
VRAMAAAAAAAAAEAEAAQLAEAEAAAAEERRKLKASNKVRKPPFLSHLYMMQTIASPRQARDKHRKTALKKRASLCATRRSGVECFECLIQMARAHSPWLRYSR